MSGRFHVGDLVQLKSGGPSMTVEEIPDEERKYNHPDKYHCVWFKGASMESGYFADHTLQPYVPPKKIT